MTKFIKSVEVNDGYNGDTEIVYLCQEIDSEQIWAVWKYGSYRYNQKHNIECGCQDCVSETDRLLYE